MAVDDPTGRTEAEPEGGWVVTEYEKWAIARLKRGLDPCTVWVDEQGREVDKWGCVVEPETSGEAI